MSFCLVCNLPLAEGNHSLCEAEHARLNRGIDVPPTTVFVGFPTGGTARVEAATAFHCPLREGTKHKGFLRTAQSCEVLMNHNVLWADAIDMYAAGQVGGFAIIHGDVNAPQGWLDTLIEESHLSGADIVSAVIPFKDDSGLTSTAVDDTNDPWMARRLTLKQIARFGQTFGDAEAGGPILLNTGLLFVKLGPWCLEENADGSSKFVFEFRHRIMKRGGKRVCQLWPDDWALSRKFREAGLKLMATKAVPLYHHDGNTKYANFGEPWGHEEDLQNGPNAPWRIALKQGFTLNQSLQGVRARVGDETKTVMTGKMVDGVTILEFTDGTTAKMADCIAI